MSEIMLHGILDMPIELAMNDELSRLQFYHAAQSALKRIEELEEICAESYLVVGALSDEAGRFDDEEVIKALDNLGAATLEHKDVIPFPCKRNWLLKLLSKWKLIKLV